MSQAENNRAKHMSREHQQNGHRVPQANCNRQCKSSRLRGKKRRTSEWLPNQCCENNPCHQSNQGPHPASTRHCDAASTKVLTGTSIASNRQVQEVTSQVMMPNPWPPKNPTMRHKPSMQRTTRRTTNTAPQQSTFLSQTTENAAPKCCACHKNYRKLPRIS